MSEETAQLSEKIQWRKIGGGSLRLANGKIIKPNQVFFARKEELPQMAIGVFLVPVSGTMPEEPGQEPVEVKQATYELFAKGIGWYDVINSETKKAINEKGMRKEEAEVLLAEIQG